MHGFFRHPLFWLSIAFGLAYGAGMASKLESDTSKESYRVIDPANVPVKPVFPNRTQIILMGIGGGLLLGLGAVVGREFLDPTLRNEEEAAAVLKLPVLASIPELTLRDIPARKKLPRAV